jgi:cytochrome oxidase assembly protein ShyY1
MRLAFRFRVIPFVATLALVVLGIVLGNWQTRRAEEKLGMAARLAERSAAPALVLGAGAGGRQQAADIEYRRVRLTGEWVRTWPLFLDNRPLNGQAGFILAMPFKIAGSHQYVLVLRGWLPRDAREYAKLPAFVTPAGTVTIEGVITRNAGQLMQLGTAGAIEPGARVQNLATDEVARAARLPMLPYFVQQAGTGQGEGLVRDWPAPATGVDKHRGYAFQWYALAAMAALFFVITGFRSGRKQRS